MSGILFLMTQRLEHHVTYLHLSTASATSPTSLDNLLGNQARSFGLSTSAFFPTTKSRIASFEVRCLLQNTARWNAARAAIPNPNALIMVSGQIVDSWITVDDRSFSTIPLMDLIRLFTNNAGGIGAAAGGG